MELIRSMIEDEDRKDPFPIRKLPDVHRDHNLNIARRTVAKYREKWGFSPPASESGYNGSTRTTITICLKCP